MKIINTILNTLYNTYNFAGQLTLKLVFIIKLYINYCLINVAKQLEV